MVHAQSISSSPSEEARAAGPANGNELERLLGRCALRDERALADLYNLVSARLLGVLLKILRSRALAEEALQDVMVRVWQRADQYVAYRGRAMPWLISIARYRAIDVPRGQRLQVTLDDAPAEALMDRSAEEFLDTTTSQRLRRALDECFKRLTPDQRKCLSLAYVDGYSQDERDRDRNPAGNRQELGAARAVKPQALHGFMNYNNPELLDELAAQYALGTLRGLARRRFQRICQQDRIALAVVRRWEDRLADLAATIAPEQPSALVWAKVQQRLGHGSSRAGVGVIGWWSRMQWAVAASVVMLVAVVGWWIAMTPADSHLVATIVDQQQTQLWRIEAPLDRQKLRVTASALLPRDEGHAYELWALPQQAGAAPVSLGLMPQGGRRALELNAAQRVALAGARQVAVSLEPVGGSPTGVPTGPVLFVAAVVSSG